MSNVRKPIILGDVLNLSEDEKLYTCRREYCPLRRMVNNQTCGSCTNSIPIHIDIKKCDLKDLQNVWDKLHIIKRETIKPKNSVTREIVTDINELNKKFRYTKVVKYQPIHTHNHIGSKYYDTLEELYEKSVDLIGYKEVYINVDNLI